MRPPTAAVSTRFILLIGVKNVVYGPTKSVVSAPERGIKALAEAAQRRRNDGKRTLSRLAGYPDNRQ
jgi:hypothetical protein